MVVVEVVVLVVNVDNVDILLDKVLNDVELLNNDVFVVVAIIDEEEVSKKNFG